MIVFLAADAVYVPILSTIGSALVLGALVWGWNQLKRNLNEGKVQLAAQNDLILEQTTKTNGRVTSLESVVAGYDKQLTIHETKIAMLVALATKGQPE